MLPQKNISQIANKICKSSGKRIPEFVIERDYCIAWFLMGLSRSSLAKQLAFKGGTALRRCYFPDYRFSEDLDFTLTTNSPIEQILHDLEPVCQQLKDLMGGRFYISRREAQRHINSFTFYLAYEGPLPAQTQTKEVKVDITLTECLVFPLQSRPILKSYLEYADFPEHDRLPVYSLEEVATEKVVALLDPARNEPRDLFDLWYLTTHEGIALDDLIPAISEKLAFRKKELNSFKDGLATKESRYSKVWEQRLSTQMGSLPRFETVFRAVQRAFRQADL